VSGHKTLDQIIQAAANAAAFFTVYRADLTRVYSADLIWQTVSRGRAH
jgi:hypothetical protein